MLTLTATARSIYRDLRREERARMTELGLDLFEDPQTGGQWLAAIGALLLKGDKESAKWLWEHPVGNAFEVASDSLLQHYYQLFGRPMGGVEDEDWIFKMLLDAPGQVTFGSPDNSVVVNVEGIAFDKGGAGSGPAQKLLFPIEVKADARELIAAIEKWLTKGGAGSGHHGHAGRPGRRGGSATIAGHVTTKTAMANLGIKHGPRLHGLLKHGMPSTKKGGRRYVKWPEAKEWYDAYTSAGKGAKGLAAAAKTLDTPKKAVKVDDPPPPPKQQQLQYRPRGEKVDTASRVATNKIRAEAKEAGVSAAGLEKAIYEKVVAITANEPIAIRRSIRGATGVLEDGRFKTQFETGRSGGCFSHKHRSDAEAKGLGIPEDVDPTQRPVYGYIQVPGQQAQASSYGAVKFTLKDEVRARTTITIGDSLGPFGRSTLVGAPATKPTKESWDNRVSSLVRDFRGLEYIEAQVQGGVTLKDVAKITFGRDAQKPWLGGNPSNTLRSEYRSVWNKAKKLGIPVEMGDDW